MSNLQHKPLANLKLDLENPRLPEDLENRSQADLLAVFYRDYDLDELAASYVANGFFESESLIILDSGIVIEGNRRLAALKYLLHDEDAKSAGIPEFVPSEDLDDRSVSSLAERIPVQVVDDRESIAAYLGFRHINGSKEWSSGSKARFVYQRVGHYKNLESSNPFLDVAREIGSNTVGVRNWYICYAILKHAEENSNLNKASKHILGSRFGVWRRVTNEDVYEYIGFEPEDMSLASIDEALERINDERLGALLGDLTPDEDGLVLLKDSRHASDYTTILKDGNALNLLRSTRDFALALSVARGSPINQQLKRVINILELVNSSLLNETVADDESLRLVTRISKQCVSIKSLINDANSDE